MSNTMIDYRKKGLSLYSDGIKYIDFCLPSVQKNRASRAEINQSGVESNIKTILNTRILKHLYDRPLEM